MSRRLKVLFIDDEPQVLEQAKLFFERKKDLFDLETTTSSERGLEMLKDEEFDAVVCDYMMPGMDGIDILTALRDGESDIPFLMLTGKGEEVVAMEALNVGADRYLRKGSESSPMNLYKVIARAVIHEVEEKRSDRNLEKSEVRYKTLFERRETPMAVVRNDDYTITLVNEKFEELSGYSEGEIKGGKTWGEFIARDDLERLEKYFQLVRENPDDAPEDFDFKFIDRDNNIKNLRISVSPISECNEVLISVLETNPEK